MSADIIYIYIYMYIYKPNLPGGAFHTFEGTFLGWFKGKPQAHHKCWGLHHLKETEVTLAHGKDIGGQILYTRFAYDLDASRLNSTPEPCLMIWALTVMMGETTRGMDALQRHLGYPRRFCLYR